jgi:CRP/FNR family transcriptional regulator, dissimilatory nitrate respiration regulator
MPAPPPLDQLLSTSLHPLCEVQSHSAGALLFLSGNKPRWMYFVNEGEVVLERHGKNGEAACLQRCQRGFVGEASLTSGRFHCDARTTRPSTVTRIPVEALRQALRDDRAFSERWIAMLSGEVRRLRLANERLSLPKVKDRLLHLLETEGSQGRYTLDCTLKQLAQQLAVTHEALYRALGELERSQRIERTDSVLRLL